MSSDSEVKEVPSAIQAFSAKNIAKLTKDAKQQSIKKIQSGGNVRPTYLSCEAIPPTIDGNYEWYQNEWLMIHETIRREVLRAELALENLDVHTNPWHATNFYIWISEYFNPMIHVHHDGEEEIVGPYYKGLGEVIEWGSAHNHQELIQLMDGIEKQAQFLYEATQAQQAYERGVNDRRNSFHMKDLRGMQELLKENFKKFKEFMFEHLKEEDSHWPGIYMKYGIEDRDKCTKQIIKRDMAITGLSTKIAFQGLLGSIFDAGGFRQHSGPKPLDCGLKLDPWCSEEFIEEFYKGLPFIPRYFIFPGWIKHYKTYWKVMIDSIAGDVDILKLDAKIEKMQANQNKKKFLLF